MRQVERHIVQQNNPFWQEIDRLCFLSKNLYNYANYIIRQAFIFDSVYLGFNQVYHKVKNSADYQALPAKVSQQVLRTLAQNWQSFFKANQAYNQTPNLFTGRPSLPKYKHKRRGRNLVTYPLDAISKRWLKKERVKLSGTNIIVATRVKNIVQARIIPKVGQYIIEIVYEKAEEDTVSNPLAVAAIDIGVNNLATLTSNQKGFIPILVNGRPLKSINQFYNKRKAILCSLLAKDSLTSKQIQRITANRNNRIETYLHQASRWIINYLDKQGISQLIIGQNPLWKQKINNGKKNNQNFVSIPHSRLIEMLRYKGEFKGIKIETSEESYTSRASFLNLDVIPNYGDENAKEIKFSGYRESRGMYKIKGEKTRINADINGSLNILRKVVPTAFSQGIEGVVVRPIRVTPG
ncbi:MAG: transposase [Xenococcaceae cyanobacterium MO_207.B15]|nr:transposase [Xenococcaceae cyanobacterium MO_207.B15]